jgi:hypothetical protein
MQVHITLKSRNVKVGPIPVSTTTRESCPPNCGMYAKGCYAAGGPLAIHWRKVSEGYVGNDWASFVQTIATLPDGQAWRHNQAGDLPGAGNDIDSGKLADLVDANRGKMGWTYTHKPMDNEKNRQAVDHANSNGFAINLSADTLAQADKLASLAIGPVVVVLDAVDGQKADTVTPEGRKVVTCPATYRDNVNCSSCLLCARINRTVIVGFPAHGTFKKAAAAVARGGK